MSDIREPSNFWRELAAYHNRQLSHSGIENFKRTINTRYFNWGILGIYSHQLTPILWCIKKGKFLGLFQAKSMDKSRGGRKTKELNFVSAFLYKIYVAALFDYVSRIDKLDLFKKIEEPIFGNPFLVSYRGRVISQDLANSIFEFYSIANGAEIPASPEILEIGAGYGRLAYVFLKVFPEASYTIVDIEPALSVSKQYLKKVLPDKSQQIRFLGPEEVVNLKEKKFNLIISVSSFQEMTLQQIEFYFAQIDRLCQGSFYTKQLNRGWIRENNFISKHEYPKAEGWKKIYERTHPIQKFFFEAFYLIP